jgi:hypothetical protein
MAPLLLAARMALLLLPARMPPLLPAARMALLPDETGRYALAFASGAMGTLRRVLRSQRQVPAAGTNRPTLEVIFDHLFNHALAAAAVSTRAAGTLDLVDGGRSSLDAGIHFFVRDRPADAYVHAHVEG